ncbi:CBS domain-containing protein [candidate division WWE3 bacterium]|nr:CBS domain-containing protein [candidate division WWE3 bacterium]
MLISEIYHPYPKTMSGDAHISDAIAELMKDEVNALVILNDNGKVIGVLSLQDIAAATVPRQFRENIRMAAAMYKPGFFTEMCNQLKDVKISKVMRHEYISVGFNDNIMAVTADFLKNDLYIVPVIENGKLMGVITRTEIKKALYDSMMNGDNA